MVDAIKERDLIKSIVIVRNGEEAKAFVANQARFNTLLAEHEKAGREKRERAQAESAALIGEKFPRAQRAGNGIYTEILKEGSGARPAEGAELSVNYKVSLLSGKVVDASEVHGRPLEFTLGRDRLIPGWELSVQEMRLGEKRLAIIPPELGYGEAGVPPHIPPDSYLVFEMELVSMRPPK